MQSIPLNTRDAKREALRILWGIKGEDGMEVVFRKITDDGSKAQEAWFNILCRMIAKDTGDDVEAIKVSVKVKAFGRHTATIGGVTVDFIPRSNLYGMEGYSQLIEGTYQLGAELGIILPDPKPKKN